MKIYFDYGRWYFNFVLVEQSDRWGYKAYVPFSLGFGWKRFPQMLAKEGLFLHFAIARVVEEGKPYGFYWQRVFKSKSLQQIIAVQKDSELTVELRGRLAK